MTMPDNKELLPDERHFISPHAKGVSCFCGQAATHKVGEEVPDSDPTVLFRHNFTQYVCCQCFTNIVGNAAFCGLTRSPALTTLRKENESLKEALGHYAQGCAEDVINGKCPLCEKSVIGCPTFHDWCHCNDIAQAALGEKNEE